MSAHWVKLSVGWPKYKYFGFDKILKNVIVGQNNIPKGNENISIVNGSCLASWVYFVRKLW
jgi:hypothetical protein